MRIEPAKLSGQREAIDAVLAKDWLKLLGVAVIGGVSALGGVVLINPSASTNVEAWRNAFFGSIPPDHITDISTVRGQVTDCAGVEFQKDFSVGERSNGELVVLDGQSEVIGLLGDGVCPNGVVVHVGYHQLKPGVLDHAWVWNAEDGDERWGGSVKHRFTDAGEG